MRLNELRWERRDPAGNEKSQLLVDPSTGQGAVVWRMHDGTYLFTRLNLVQQAPDILTINALLDLRGELRMRQDPRPKHWGSDGYPIPGTVHHGCDAFEIAALLLPFQELRQELPHE